ncbi:MAG: hypothetical protein OEU46_06670 [Alphaproteobacteria bacterium]|nr:hypothetical protein [Alphaproteobacteria bacterium]
MSDHDAGTSGDRIVFHLVHGTGAENAPWTRPDSFFRKHLQKRLRDHGLSEKIEFTAPWWGGENRHTARLSGVEKVRAEVCENVGNGKARVRQVLVGHSHGGNVCFLACKDENFAKKVVGAVCLSTPFLVFRRARYLRSDYLACWVAWWMVALAVAVVITNEAWKAMFLSLPVPLAFAAFYFWAYRRRYEDLEAISAPESLPVPSLLIRCPGDEASGIFGVSLVLERARVVATTKVASLWGWFKQHWIVYILFAALAGVGVAAAMFASMALTGSLDALKLPVIFLSVLFFILLVLPLLAGFPVRILLYGFSFGFDVATRGIFLAVTAETAPPGVWQVQTIHTQSSEFGAPTLTQAHSEPYNNEEAIETIALWVKRLVEADESRDP